MNGAIFYASRYGSTREYAQWIAEATGLPAYHVDAPDADPAAFDFLVLGSPVIYYKVIFSDWVERHLDTLQSKPIVLFTVSGAPAGERLNGWIADSMPQSLTKKMHHFALRGRQIRSDLNWYDWTMLTIVGLMNPNRQAAREERQGFDYMDRDSIQPIVDLIKDLQSANGRNQQDGLSINAGQDNPA